MKIIRKYAVVLISGILLLSGCKAQSNPVVSAKVDTATVIKQLQQENAKLKSKLESAVESIEFYKKGTNKYNPIELTKELPFLSKFQPGIMYEKITISIEGDGTVPPIEIKSREIIDSLSSEVGVIADITDRFPNGPQVSDNCYVFKLYTEGEEIAFTTRGGGVIEFQEARERYFQVSEGINNLAIALAKKPYYIEKANIFDRMRNGGMLYINRLEGGSKGYVMLSSFRIKGLVNIMLKDNMKRVPEAPLNIGNPFGSFTIYYYGEKINIKLFESYIMLQDSKEEYWYEASSDAILGIVSFLSAG